MVSFSRRAALACTFGLGTIAGAASAAAWPDHQVNESNVAGGAPIPTVEALNGGFDEESSTPLDGPAAATESAPAELAATATTSPAATNSSTQPSAVQPSAAQPSEPAPQRLIGMHIDDIPYQGLDLLDPVEDAIGTVDVVHWYQAWGGGHRFFRPDWLETVNSAGKVGLITWEPWALTGEASQPDYSPAAILSGRHDDYIRSWAYGFAARSDGPWYLRPMHEMNGNWYPWSGGVVGGNPEEYRAAWIHMHDTFTAAGVENVEWVWCPLVDDISGPFEDYYPGDEYVDVLCLDGYNWGTTDPDFGAWRSVSAVFDDAYDRLVLLGDQPVWFGEVGSAAEGGDKVAWTADLLSSSRYSQLEAVIFFGLDKERDWRVQSDPAVAEAVRLNR